MKRIRTLARQGVKRGNLSQRETGQGEKTGERDNCIRGKIRMTA